MAIAYYPTKIRKFTQHVDQVDLVEADDMNSVQNELTAVMQIVGINPQIYNDIQVDYNPATGSPNDTGGLSTDDTLFFSTTLRYYDPKVKPVDHGTVAERLDDIERGEQFHSFCLRATQIDLPSSSTNLQNRPNGIRFGQPSSSNDPFSLWNGVGVTIRKTGFYIFSGNIVFALQGPNPGNNDGNYQGAIDYDNNFVEGIDRRVISGVNTHPSVSPLLMGFFNRGARISLRTSQDSGRTQKIRMARLAGICLRETPGS